jgi:hypothetical protein
MEEQASIHVGEGWRRSSCEYKFYEYVNVKSSSQIE